MTAIYMAFSANTGAINTLINHDFESMPLSLLVSFVYTREFYRTQNKWKNLPPRTMLDSGAFSAWNSGETIDIEALMTEAAKGWGEAIALDVINNPTASLQNALFMKSRGLDVMPVFHFGEPFEILGEYKREFPRIGLSCRFGEPVKQSMNWLEVCFKRAYPAKFHSFGWVTRKMLERFPFWTADTASWTTVMRFGQSRYFGRVPRAKATSRLDAEVRFYYELQHYLKSRWKKEFEENFQNEPTNERTGNIWTETLGQAVERPD